MRDLRFAKFVMIVNGAMPLALLGWDAWRGQLGANGVNFALRTTGFLSLIFLLLSLAVTPVRKLAGQAWLVQFRRGLGLYAFFYAALHFAIFYGLDRAMSLASTLSEIRARTYLMVGIVGLLAMAPLAATSTNGMIRRLGPKRWKALHRLAYVAAVAGAVHVYMLQKADVTKPLAFAAVLAALLGYRLIAHYLALRSAANAAKAPAAAAPPTIAKPKFWTGQLRVARVFDETANVRTFRLVPPDGGDLPFRHLPGQYLNLALQIGGTRVPRSYTIASSPTQAGYCEVTVKREVKREDVGSASRHLHDMPHEGSLLNVSAPAGRFVFTGVEADGVVLIAGGVGITPLMAIVRYLTDRCWPGAIDLFFSVRTEADVIFADELDRLARRFPNFRPHVTVTRPNGDAWAGLRGRITAAMLRQVVPDLASRLAYICGPTPMIEPTRQMLREAGVAEDRIKTEAFVSPGRPAAGAVDTTGANVDIAVTQAVLADPAEAPAASATTVTFARSGKRAPLSPGKTVLEAAEDVGVPLDFECRAGICGTCKVRLTAGGVSMEVKEALDAREQADGYILACQAQAAADITVDA